LFSIDERAILWRTDFRGQEKGRTIWIVDAHRGDGKRLVVRAEEKLTELLELESIIRPCGKLS
jgi:hypothetical protein